MGAEADDDGFPTIENDPARGEPRLAGAALSRTEPDRTVRSVQGSPASVRRREPVNRNGSITGAVVRRIPAQPADRGTRARPASANPPAGLHGDYAGDLLYATLLEYGFAKGSYQARPDDGLTLVDCRISTRCTACRRKTSRCPRKSNVCRQFLSRRSRTCRAARIVALGRIAHESTLNGTGLAARRGAVCAWRDVSGRRDKALRQLSLLALQHQHAGLTPAMFRKRVAKVRAI